MYSVTTIVYVYELTVFYKRKENVSTCQTTQRRYYNKNLAAKYTIIFLYNNPLSHEDIMHNVQDYIALFICQSWYFTRMWKTLA